MARITVEKEKKFIGPVAWFLRGTTRESGRNLYEHVERIWDFMTNIFEDDRVRQAAWSQEEQAEVLRAATLHDLVDPKHFNQFLEFLVEDPGKSQIPPGVWWGVRKYLQSKGLMSADGHEAQTTGQSGFVSPFTSAIPEGWGDPRQEESDRSSVEAIAAALRELTARVEDLSTRMRKRIASSVIDFDAADKDPVLTTLQEELTTLATVVVMLTQPQRTGRDSQGEGAQEAGGTQTTQPYAPSIEQDQLVKLLVGMQLAEIIGEGVREVKDLRQILESTDEFERLPLPQLVSFKAIKWLIKHYGTAPLLIKAAEKLDNLAYPLCYTGKCAKRKSEEQIQKAKLSTLQDVFEAFYFFIPALEILGYYELMEKLKDKAVEHLLMIVGSLGPKNIKKLREQYNARVASYKGVGPLSLQEFNSEVGKKPPLYLLLHGLVGFLKAPSNKEPVIKMPEASELLKLKAASPEDASYVRLPEDVDAWVLARHKSWGSAVLKFIRYFGLQELRRRVEQEEFDIFADLPDLFGVRLILKVSDLNTVVEKLWQLDEFNSYQHPKKAPRLEHIISDRGYVAVHWVFVIKKDAIPQFLETLGFKPKSASCQRLREALEDLSSKSLSIEIQFLTQSAAAMAFNFAAHIVYKAAADSAGSAEDATLAERMQEAAKVVFKIRELRAKRMGGG